MNMANATGWAKGESPKPAQAFAVNAFARDLDHPRWLYVLPNGDVLVAESNAPQRPEEGKGVKGFVFRIAQKRAGAGAKSADRITL
jgi:glucose/arabinose dehydrogenase